MTNDMFTPPERRPVPAHLRARILAEVDAAVATSGQRPRRWLAPLIACGLAVAGVGGTLSLRESPACTQWQSPRGLMRKAAMVLCGSCSAEMAVSRITM